MAATILVGQAMGRHDQADAKRVIGTSATFCCRRSLTKSPYPRKCPQGRQRPSRIPALAARMKRRKAHNCAGRTFVQFAAM
jgi:hypothetical protein